MRKILPVAAALYVAALSTTAIVSAATTGIVRGTVTIKDAPAPNVAVVLAGEGVRLQTTSGARGAFAFLSVPFGTYRLSASAPGLPAISTEVSVASGSVALADLAISPLATIAEAASHRNVGATGTPISQTVVGRAQLAALPTNDSLSSVVQTVPGVVRFSYGEPVAHGFHGVTYEIDGAPLPLATSSNFAEVIDPKDVDRVEIATGAFPAEYGGSRQGAVVNIVTNNALDLKSRDAGTVAFGAGTQGQAQSSLDESVRVGELTAFLTANARRTDRGIDAPTYAAINDAASQSNEFLRVVGPPNARASWSLDLSNQLAQFQIPINTDPNNPNDPQVSVPGTLDVQREYDRFATFNYTLPTRDQQGYLKIIPWVRFTRIAYDGDLANDVLATIPDPNTGIPVNLTGLRQNRRAEYVGLRAADFRSTLHHNVKVGIDIDRETFASTQTLANLGQPDVNTSVAQAGSQTGIYAQDKWIPSRAVSVDYGLRYDLSTGFVAGNQLSPRIGVNVAAGRGNVVHAYYGRLYAAPQLEDVRQDCVVLAGCSGTPAYDLKPETDTYAEFGIARQFSPATHGYVNVFERRVSNVLDTTQLLNTPIFAVYNNALGRAYGVEFRLDAHPSAANSWFLSSTISRSVAAGISGSTFLFPPSQLSSGFQPEDHDQTYEANGAFTHRFGFERSAFASLQVEYGSGYPVQFQSGTGRLPTHLLLDASVGRKAGTPGFDRLGIDLTVTNLLNHQYVIKIANGFNTTQIAEGRSILLRLTAPLGERP